MLMASAASFVTTKASPIIPEASTKRRNARPFARRKRPFSLLNEMSAAPAIMKITAIHWVDVRCSFSTVTPIRVANTGMRDMTGIAREASSSRRAVKKRGRPVANASPEAIAHKISGDRGIPSVAKAVIMKPTPMGIWISPNTKKNAGTLRKQSVNNFLSKTETRAKKKVLSRAAVIQDIRLRFYLMIDSYSRCRCNLNGDAPSKHRSPTG